MATHPLNLVLRFILEMTALFIVGLWSWNQTEGFMQFVLAIGAPAILAIIWGVFAVKDDPTRSGKTVVPTAGFMRLIIELGIFGFSVWAIFSLGYKMLSIILLTFVVIHYISSFDRVIWLVKKHHN